MENENQNEKATLSDIIGIEVRLSRDEVRFYLDFMTKALESPLSALLPRHHHYLLEKRTIDLDLKWHNFRECSKGCNLRENIQNFYNDFKDDIAKDSMPLPLPEIQGFI